MPKTIAQLQKEVHENAIAKGWYEKEKSIPEHLALIHSEVSEALEADRGNAHSVYGNINTFILPTQDNEEFKKVFEIHAKDTFPDELADIVIRVMDLAEWKGIDLQSHIEAKIRYNAMRSH
jgi:NTP pyrophosphatase (non-canonical NTP hydrolase)